MQNRNITCKRQYKDNIYSLFKVGPNLQNCGCTENCLEVSGNHLQHKFLLNTKTSFHNISTKFLSCPDVRCLQNLSNPSSRCLDCLPAKRTRWGPAGLSSSLVRDLKDVLVRELQFCLRRVIHTGQTCTYLACNTCGAGIISYNRAGVEEQPQHLDQQVDVFIA